MAERVEELEAETKNLRELLANSEIKHKEVMPRALALSSVLGHTPADVTSAARVQSLEKVKETSKTFLKKAIDKKNALEVAVCCIPIPFRVASFHLGAPCRHASTSTVWLSLFAFLSIAPPSPSFHFMSWHAG